MERLFSSMYRCTGARLLLTACSNYTPGRTPNLSAFCWSAAGLTPAQLQMLISSPPEQVWRLAAQMGVFKQCRNGQMGQPVRPANPAGFVNSGSAASQANYINAMAHLHQLHGHHAQTPPQPAAPNLGQPLPDGYTQQLNGGLLQQQILRQQQQQQAQVPVATDNSHRVLLELGKTFAALGITVEAAINAGLLGGLAVADVHTLCEANAAEVHRMQLTGIQPQPHLANQVFGNQAALKPDVSVADLLARSGVGGGGAPAANPAILAAARQQQALVSVRPRCCCHRPHDDLLGGRVACLTKNVQVFQRIARYLLDGSQPSSEHQLLHYCLPAYL